MKKSFETEVIQMLTPKIKSVLRQTQQQYRDDLEQELILLVLTKIENDSFSNLPSFFDLISEENKLMDHSSKYSKFT